MTFKDDLKKGLKAVKDRAYSDGTRVFRVKESWRDLFGFTGDSVYVDSFIMKGDRKGVYERRRLPIEDCANSIPATPEEIEMLDKEFERYASFQCPRIPEEKPYEESTEIHLDQLIRGKKKKNIDEVAESFLQNLADDEED
jgi:hypothetical protein